MIVTKLETKMETSFSSNGEQTFTHCELNPPGEHFILSLKETIRGHSLLRSVVVDSSVALLSFVDEKSLPIKMLVAACRLELCPESSQSSLRQVVEIFRDSRSTRGLRLCFADGQEEIYGASPAPVWESVFKKAPSKLRA